MDENNERTQPSARHILELRRRAGASGVDVLDVAAELETQGLSSSEARGRFRAVDTFEVARSIFGLRGGHATDLGVNPRMGAADLQKAMVRAVALLLGCAMVGLAAYVARIEGAAVVVGTALAWIGSQGGAAVTWSRLAGAGAEGAARLGARWAVVALCVGSLVGLGILVAGTGHLLASSALFLVGVQYYSALVSVLVAADRAGGCIAVLGPLTVVVVATRLMPGPWTDTVATASVLVALALLTVLLARTVRTSAESLRLSAVDAQVCLPPTLQATWFAMATLLLISPELHIDPLLFLPAVLFAVAAVDPLVVLLRMRLQTAAITRTDYRDTASPARVLTLTVNCAAVALYLAVVLGCGVLFDMLGTPALWAVAAAGSVYVVQACLSSTLRGFGAPWLSALAALPVLAAVAAWLWIGPLPAVAVAAVGCLATMGTAMHLAAEPRRYL